MRNAPGTTRFRTFCLVGVAATSLVLAACSSSSSDGGSSSSGSSAESLLGTPNKATGSPIVIGIHNGGKIAAIDTTSQNVAIRALTKYANDYLGGINGHVIQLKECDTLNTPAQENDCAQQAISAKVSAVLQSSPDDVTAKAVTGAGIPLVAGLAASQTTLAAPDLFSIGNGLGVYGAPAAYAESKGYKNAALLVIDVPAASGPAKQLGPAFFKNAGASLDVVSIAPGTADMTPQVQTTLAKKPQMYYVLGDSTFCTSAIKAVKTLAPDAEILMLNNCISSSATGIPGGYAGIKTVTTQAADTTDPDYQLFLQVQKKYDGATDAMAVFGYVPMLGLIRALNGAKITDTSAAGVAAGMKAAPAEPLPLGKGATFQCNGTAISVSKNICSLAAFVADTDAAGKNTNFRLFDDPAIYKLG